MKTINKILISIFPLCLFLGLFTTACTEDVIYTPAEQLTNAQVYFSNTLSSKIELPRDMDVSSFNVELRRIITTDALTVNLTVENGNPDIFSVPTSVSFASGSDMTNIIISYDPAKLDFDDFSSIQISVPDANLTSPYGNFVYSFSVGKSSPWLSLGIATFSDAFMFDDSYNVELQQNEIDPTRYRLVDPYSEGLINEGYGLEERTGNQCAYLEFQVLPKGYVYNAVTTTDANVSVTTTMDGLVGYPDFSTGYLNLDYDAEVVCIHPARRDATSAESAWLHNIVLQFSATGEPEVVQLAPWYFMFGVGGYNYTTYDGVITIVFPGVELVNYDYSAEIEYTGRLTDPSGNDFATANVTLGADVAYAQVALVPGSFNFDDLFDIIDGVIESVEIKTSGAVSIPCDETGTYTFIVISYDANDEAQEYDAATFDFYSSAGGGAGTVSIEDFYGNYVMTGPSQFGPSEPDADMSVSIEKGDNSNTLIIKGIDFTGDITATFDPATGYMYIAPQDVDDINYGGVDYPMFMYTTTAEGDISDEAVMAFARRLDGALVFAPTSEADGYLLGIDLGWWDGYYDIVFTPTAMKSASTMKSTSSKLAKGKEVKKTSIVRKAKRPEENVVIKQKGLVRNAFRNHIGSVSF